MLSLANLCPSDNLHVTDLPYRLSSWALDDPHNIGLWFDEDQRLVAWAVLQTPFWTIDIVCHPGFEKELFPQILHWADARARLVLGTPYGHPAWFVMAFPGQADRIRNLEALGFACQSDVGEDSWSKVFMRRPGQVPVEVPSSPSGFIVRPLAGDAEVERYVELHQSVFESKNMTVEWRRRILQHPSYKPGLDLVVEAPGGRLAAFCICWFNEITGDSQVEPLGSHVDFRGLGLGRLVLAEGLRRLQALGSSNIYVETDKQRNAALSLYQSEGFEVIQDVLVYRKDY
jgi:ribosomal protein S18 acetylase RimI-like enzyme